MLGLVMLAGAVAGWGRPERYAILVAFDDGSALQGLRTSLGMVDADTQEIRIARPDLPSSGLVTEAFIADRTRPNLDEARVLSFPGPQPRDLETVVSREQIDRMWNDAYVLVIRTRGVPAGRIVGQALSRPCRRESQIRRSLVGPAQWRRPGRR